MFDLKQTDKLFRNIRTNYKMVLLLIRMPFYQPVSNLDIDLKNTAAGAINKRGYSNFCLIGW